VLPEKAATMSTEMPPRDIGDEIEINPYAPPEASLSAPPTDLIPAGDLAAAEAVRRAHIGHEASIRSIGVLHYMAAFFAILAAASVVLVSLTALQQRPQFPRIIMIAAGGVYALIGALHLALGLGLRRLQNWARYTDAVLIAGVLFIYGIAAVVNLATSGDPRILIVIGGVATILGYILYLLLSSRAATIFSAEYKAIIEQTPHIRYQTSLLVKIFLAMLVAVLALAVIGGIVASIVGR
jgi:hypothetical protein